MPTALSPSSRVRSRTSDISDFLRGRHDPKASTDLHPPPVPHLPEPVTPPKNKSKFAFLGRKRKPSFSPSSAKSEAAAAVAASDGAQKARHSTSVPAVPGTNALQSSPAAPIGRLSPQKTLPTLPPLNVFSSSSSESPFRSTPSASTHYPHHAGPAIPILTMRRQKASSESSRRSTESRSVRPIITVSPPHNTIHEAADAYTSPRAAPSPSRLPKPNESTLPTPTPSDKTAISDSPTSADIPSPTTSTTSVAHFPNSADGTLPAASSFKEESLLRKDHFELGSTTTSSRRGTVSFNSPNKATPATVGPSFSPTRQERRHVSVVQLNRLKNEITATAPRIGKKSSDLSAVGRGISASPLARSNTVAVSPPHAQQGSRAPTPQGRRIPPPLKRTWHTPPSTGPPREPLPSPPASAQRISQTPPTAESFRTAPSPSPTSPVSARRTLPPPRSSKDTGLSSRTTGATSPRSSLSASIPPSPSRSEPESDVPVVKTPVREDPAQRALADEEAGAEQLRDALKTQTEKYARLSAYLLNLTERHALEKAELMRRVEVLEQEVVRREREMKGLKWLVANGGAGRGLARPGVPAREDSNTLPRSHVRSGSQATTRSRVGSMGKESVGRGSCDSPAGSVEEGLVELQTTISEFITPTGDSSMAEEQQNLESVSQTNGTMPVMGSVRTRTRRSNTVPDGIVGAPRTLLQVYQTQSSSESSSQRLGLGEESRLRVKAARRTSSPVIPSSIPAPGIALSLKRPSASSVSLAGLGLGVGVAAGAGAVGSPLHARSISRSPSPELAQTGGRDMHVRCDSSTLSSLPSLATLHSSSSVSGLSSIPETPRTDLATLDDDGGEGEDGCEFVNNTKAKRLSGSSLSPSSSPSIGQVLDRTRVNPSRKVSVATHQPEMDAIMRKLRAFGHGYSSSP